MQRWVGTYLLVVCLVWLPASAASAERLWGVLGGLDEGADDAGAVVEIDLDSGEVTVLRTPLPGVGLSGVATLPSGRVFATTEVPDGESSLLLELDPASGGLLRVIGEMSIDTAPFFRVHDLTAVPTTGELIAIGRPGQNQVAVVDLETAVATFLGFVVYSPFPIPNISPIASGPGGELWTKIESSEGIFQLVDVEPPDVEGFGHIYFPGTPDNVGATGLVIHPESGLVYFSECCTLTQGNDVWVMAAPNYSATLVVSAGGSRQIEDLTFVGDLPSVVEVPTLSPVALVGLAGLLAAGAALILRRQRQMPAKKAPGGPVRNRPVHQGKAAGSTRRRSADS
ncbi:MAG: IPTL-CTERM sorting domain-containing protein [Acidobacteriota bacterium]|nr:IPTL-CTERM sorting domain-containing protein [Acidobacteriota bacterium]